LFSARKLNSVISRDSPSNVTLGEPVGPERSTLITSLSRMKLAALSLSFSSP